MNLNLTLLGQAITFAIFIWFTMKFVWPPIMKAISERQKQIADGLAAAAQGQDSLQHAHKAANEELAVARKRAAEVLDGAHKRAEQMITHAKEKAQEKVHVYLSKHKHKLHKR